ncbi:uncharacterized protein LOC127262017 [Andrographis paniculata]|uniref:uncharacterized protein LOC127262017 n=1 Tax=Andrographis paniculata TaxID=175694 RepID=UPI0021E98756|nr:uncharacterized protein LOC127262017 [Andrographis paniculata]
MFKNTFQSGFLSILYSLGSKPLQIWDKKESLNDLADDFGGFKDDRVKWFIHGVFWDNKDEYLIINFCKDCNNLLQFSKLVLCKLYRYYEDGSCSPYRPGAK